MTPSEYINLSARTDGDTQRDNFAVAYENNPTFIADLIHASDGVCTEAGELKDAVKRHLFYGKPLDTTNIKEEVGDVLWYIAKICRDTGLTFDECMAANIKKLQTRFPNKFTNDAALDRNLHSERNALEDNGMVPVMDGRRKG